MVALLLAGAAVPAIAAAQEMPPSAASSPQDEAYSYIDDADSLLDAMGTSPPDYGFRFDGVDCWAWSMPDGYLILAEPLGDDYRYYIFGPDDDYPFFVGDQVYAYGFYGGQLAAVYGDNGDLIDPSPDVEDGAAWLSDRGAAMKRAMQDRQPVYADDWADSVGWFGAIELRLDTWRNRPGWIRYRAGPGRYHHHRDWRTKLGDEGARRRQRAQWFEQWRRDGYHGKPQGGNWVTAPGGTHPGKGSGKGHWLGRQRPVAPTTPGAGPDHTRGGDGGPGFGRRPHPPRNGAPSGPTMVTPTPAPAAALPPPVVVAPPSGKDGRDRPPHLRPQVPAGRDGPVVVTPPSPPAPAAASDGGRPDRPRSIFRFGRGDRSDGAGSPNPVPRAIQRVPPVAVAPRSTFVPHAAPPPSPPPPAAARVAPSSSPSVPRSAGSGSSSRGSGGGGGSSHGGGGGSRGSGGNWGGKKGK
jgi:hypothetical protein